MKSKTRLIIKIGKIFLFWIVALIGSHYFKEYEEYKTFAIMFPLLAIYTQGCLAVFKIGYELFVLSDSKEAHAEL